MLYRYPMEQKTSRETVEGRNRYDRYTGEELPPVPYLMYSSDSAKQTQNTAKGSGAASAAAAQQKYNMKKAALDRNRDDAKNLLHANFMAQQKKQQQLNNDALRQLYIAYMQGIKNVPVQQAVWGAGGGIESLKMQHRTNYEDNRARQNAQYNGIINEIQQKYNNDLLELERKYLSQLMNL